MTDLDLTPAGLRELADNWCPASECRPDDGIEDRMAHTLRALADQMEAYAPTNFDNPPGNWTEKAAEGAAAIVAAITHPTIEKMAVAIDEATDNAWTRRMVIGEMRKDQAKAAARVILAAEPSEAEVEAAVVATSFAQGLAKTETEARERMLVDKTATPELYASDIRTMRAAIKAANAAKAKEMGL